MQQLNWGSPMFIESSAGPGDAGEKSAQAEGSAGRLPSAAHLEAHICQKEAPESPSIRGPTLPSQERCPPVNSTSLLSREQLQSPGQSYCVTALQMY